jgi:transposase
MLDAFLFPTEWNIGMEAVANTENGLRIDIRCTTKYSCCPACETASERIHSIYWRHPKDVPFGQQTVGICMRVRRFFCDNENCGRGTFAAPMKLFLGIRARRTIRLLACQRAVAYAVGGEAGSKLCSLLQIPTSADSLIRAIRQTPEAEVATPSVLGIDDWAKRKGQAYGTILVDLETHQPVDLLDTRTVEAVTAWLKAHPGVTLITRDRGTEYIKGANDGCPDAGPVADRWHLLSNLREALVALLEENPEALQAVADEAFTGHSIESRFLVPPESTVEVDLSALETMLPIESAQNETSSPGDPRQARRQARYAQVHALYAATGSLRSVARQLRMSRRAVKRYLEATHCPEYPKGRLRVSKLSPFLGQLHERWLAGCTNASQLWREIQSAGFTGSRGLVARWAAQQRVCLPLELRYRRQQASNFQRPPLSNPVVVPWSAKRASWLIVKKYPDLDVSEKQALERMRQVTLQVALGVDLAQQFMVIVRQRLEDRLTPWLAQVTASAIPALVCFANGLTKDLIAVRNALHYPYSNVQTEGQVNRLKFIKRSMYGRANFDLLRKCVLARSLPD